MGQAALVGAQDPGGADVFLGAVTRVIELRTEREMVQERSRIPSAFHAMLFPVSILSLGCLPADPMSLSIPRTAYLGHKPKE